MGLCATDWKNLQAIAAQAYGSGWFEKSNGGEGYMGLIKEECGKAVDGEKGTDKEEGGKIRVFKCLTHRGERAAFDREENEIREQLLQQSSVELKKELLHLAKIVGIDNLDVTLSRNQLLSRKVVARAVTRIAAAGGRTNFWREIRHPGTVGSSMPQLADCGKGTLDPYRSPLPVKEEGVKTEARWKTLKLANWDGGKATIEGIGIGGLEFDRLPCSEKEIGGSLEEIKRRLKEGVIGRDFYGMIADSVVNARSLLGSFGGGVGAVFGGELNAVMNVLCHDENKERAFATVKLVKNRADARIDDNYLFRAFFEKSLERAIREYEYELYFEATCTRPKEREELLARGLDDSQKATIRDRLVDEYGNFSKKAASDGVDTDYFRHRFALLLRKAMLSTFAKMLAVKVVAKVKGFEVEGLMSCLENLDESLKRISDAVEVRLSFFNKSPMENYVQYHTLINGAANEVCMDAKTEYVENTNVYDNRTCCDLADGCKMVVVDAVDHAVGCGVFKDHLPSRVAFESIQSMIFG